MNNLGPTHLTVPQMQALPWIKCRKELSHSTKQQADSKVQRVRERKTPIYSFTASFSPSYLLSLPPLSYPLRLFLSAVLLPLWSFLSHKHTHLNTLIHSAHSPAQVRQPHISPCSAPRLTGQSPARCSHHKRHQLSQLNQVWRCLNPPRRSRCLFGMELQSFESSSWKGRLAEGDTGSGFQDQK